MKSFKDEIDRSIPEALSVLSKPSIATVKEASIILGMTFGPEMTDYLLNYGALSFKTVEFNGITETKKNNSSLVRNTAFLREAFPNKLEGFALIEDRGDGDYVLCNSQDRILQFTPEISLEMVDTGHDLIEYTLMRYQES